MQTNPSETPSSPLPPAIARHAPATRLGLAAGALLLGSLLIGLAQVAMLPPWEGLDEFAHYSYVEQISDTGTWPRFGDPTSANVEDYFQLAPGPSPLDLKWNYLRFFAASPDVVEAGRSAIHSPRDPSRAWRPGHGFNWEAQHPPFYYWLMAPAYRFSKGWSLAAQLLLLRGLSYLLAWAGLCLALVAMLDKGGDDARVRACLILAPALWPYLFPTWFPEMGRLGNNSLLALLTAGSWLILSRIESKNGSGTHYVALGAVVGAGLLTKATFLPFVAAVTAFLCVRIWQHQANAAARRGRLRGLLAFIAVAAAISGWWYVGKLIETGNVIGSNDMILLNRAGGLLEGLEQHGSLYLFLRSTLFLPISFLWSGTWSAVVPPMPAYIPLLLTTAAIAIGYLRHISSRQRNAVDWVPLAALLLLVGSLINHGIVLMALLGVPAILGWYIHSYAPALATLSGYGLAGAMALPWLRRLLSILIWYPSLFLMAAFGLQGIFYAGCSTRPTQHVAFDPSSFLACATDLGSIFARLSVVSFPFLAATLFLAGWTAMLVGVWSATASLRRAAPPRTGS